MATTTTRQNQQTAKPAVSQGQVAVLPAPRLPPPEDRVLAEYEVNREGWRTLTESIFPAAKTVTSVMMALDYCKRRKLDVFKHPVHIVPIWNSQAGEGGKGAYVETIWPGINELRTTAIRTGQYAGMDVPIFGPMIHQKFEGKIKKWKNGSSYYETETAEVMFPEWCQITVYRTLGGNRVPFPGPRVFWLEAYARLRNDVEIPNSMWQKRANGQIEKCAEAAALRRAFPEELGSDYSIDEIGAFTTHQPTDITSEGVATTGAAPAEPQRGDYENKEPSPGASPHSNPAEGGQAVSEAKSPAAGGETVASGQSTKPVTDVEDLSEAGEGQPEEPQPLVFEDYAKAGEFFSFADEWLQEDHTEAEIIAFGTFYHKYMQERLNPEFKSPRVHEAMLDTKTLYDDALARAQKKR